jgi:NADH:ubiquinone oxidoreductase subunit F (NADH-binding)
MEGHRGEPRNKPPFPASNGLWGKPTLMNSVETFAAIPIILERGAVWWKDQGIRGGVGLKFFAISGHVVHPDVYCVPMGTTARELIAHAGGLPDGVELGGFQPGGASSNFLGPDQLDVPLDFKPLADAGSMLGSGAVVVIGDQTNLLAAATNVLRFFRNESCGKCVPCRVGSHKAHRILTDALDRGAGADDIDDRIDKLEETLRLTSICALGQVALGPAMSVLRMQRTPTSG